MTVSTTTTGYLEAEYMSTAYLTSLSEASMGVQVTHTIAGNEKPAAVQFNANILDYPGPSGAQVNHILAGFPNELAVEYKNDSLTHLSKGKYLQSGGYMEDSYLASSMCAIPGVQVELNIDANPVPLGTQFESAIKITSELGAQVKIVFPDNESPYGLQFAVNVIGNLGVQLFPTFYNVNKLRVLWEFPSRGVAADLGLNWLSNSTEVGDFSVNNLNTDIVEQVWRSELGVITGINLDCNTGIPQGIFMDTFAIINHNLTPSADVFLIGSDDPGFGNILFSERIIPFFENAYYIHPTLPNIGIRYWRVQIDDPANVNVDNFIQMGVIVFGSSMILQGECMTDRVKFKQTDYADKIQTEGFTNVSNSRAIRRELEMEFRNFEYSGQNFVNFKDIFTTLRTTLKALWIPTPSVSNPSVNDRFAVFAKLKDIPQEDHNYKADDADYVDFTIELDESL